MKTEIDPAMTAELTVDEAKRLKAYTDTRGNVTIGVGRNLSAVGISDAECALLLTNDLASHAADLDRVYPWWRMLPEPQARVMLNLCFNMGIATFSGFIVFNQAVARHDWQEAAVALKASAWWGEVGARGPRMVARLLTEIDA